MKQILETINELQYCLGDIPELLHNGNIIKHKLIAKLKSLDELVISILCDSSYFVKEFGIDNGNIDIDKIIFLLEQNELLPEAYTSFRNRLGLISDRGFLVDNSDITISVPFKDNIYRGNTAPPGQKMKLCPQLYLHNVMDKEQIDYLLLEKAFNNPQKISKTGKKDIDTISDTDNLVIKGENLTAISTLLHRYRKKVKLILIDPPYNTGNDTFKYNDTFPRSTWVNFMKDRIKLAKDLLTDDGIMVVTIDRHESHILRILLDEILGVDNFVSEVIWEKKKSRANDSKTISNVHDTIYFYKMNNNKSFSLNKLRRPPEMDNDYDNKDNDPNGPWRISPLTAPRPTTGGDVEYVFPNGVVWKPGEATSLRYTAEKLDALYHSGAIYFGINGTARPQKKTYLKDVKERGVPPRSIWSGDEVGTNKQAKHGLKKLLNSNKFATPKPEKLFKQIIQLTTDPGDIVLDFFAGSGTTAAVAHKMSRQYIVVEQMDHVDTVIVPRLTAIINGQDQKFVYDTYLANEGKVISEEWQGDGGEFIYCELAKNNQKIIDSIDDCVSLTELIQILDIMKRNNKIRYDITFKGIDISKIQLVMSDVTLIECKRFFAELLDYNDLYINYCDINSTDNGLNDNAKNFTRKFYNR